MKKVLLLMVCICTFTCAYSQEYFSLTEKGFVSKDDAEKGFIVIDKQGESQQTLFNSIKSFVIQSYVSPKDVISETGNEMITLNGISTKDVIIKKGLGVLNVKINYTIVFHFKDEKIRIDRPSLNKMSSESWTIGGQLSSVYSIYLSKNDVQSAGTDWIIIFNGKKVNENAKANIESYFNALIDKAVNASPIQKEEW